MILKDILNNVLLQSGFLEKTSFTNNPDVEDKQMIAIANRTAIEIRDFYPWAELRKVYTITPQVGKAQYPMPDDYLSLIADSAWEVDGSRRVELPTPDGRWYMYKFSAFSDGGIIRAKMYGKTMEIANSDKGFTGEPFSVEYMSNAPITSADEVPKERFTADDDEWLLDDQLLILGIQAHWQQTKLMPQYMEHMANYRAKTSEDIGRAAGGRTIGGFGIRKGMRDDPYYPLYRRTS
jgi:hypothetical protein